MTLPLQPVTDEMDEVEPGMLALLACPHCPTRPSLRQDSATTLACDRCGRTYPVLAGGIPDLRPEGDAAPAPALSGTTITTATANDDSAATADGPATAANIR